jgi:membrane dipeptidase
VHDLNDRGLAIALLAAALCACSEPPPPSPQPAEPGIPTQSAAPAPTAHERLLTLDTHVDIPLDFATDTVDPLDADLQVNLLKMRTGGLDAAFFIVYVGQTERTPENYARAQTEALTKFTAIHRMVETYPDRIELARRADDVERIVASGKLAAAIGMENGYVIGTDLALLDRYYDLGGRYLSLVHNGNNDLGHSAQPRPELGDAALDDAAGITELGARAIERMNDLGIMVDVSHASKRTALDAMRLSAAPVIASHSSVLGVASHARNMDDETLLALRDDGGVVQIVAFDSYVKYQPPEQIAAMRALRERHGVPPNGDLEDVPEAQRFEFLRGVRDLQQQWPPATVKELVDHIDYAVRLIGIDHVGISSDFGGGGGVIGWTDAAETANVTQELQARGYDEQQLAKLWGGNLLRVWRAAEAVAAERAADAARGER